jgi:hypothetical protein
VVGVVAFVGVAGALAAGAAALAAASCSWSCLFALSNRYSLARFRFRFLQEGFWLELPIC